MDYPWPYNLCELKGLFEVKILDRVCVFWIEILYNLSTYLPTYLPTDLVDFGLFLNFLNYT
jgi:hypothetical protein